MACEISTMDELIGTELVFNNILTHLEPAEIVALLSCFVFEQKNKEKVPRGLTPKLMVGIVHYFNCHATLFTTFIDVCQSKNSRFVEYRQYLDSYYIILTVITTITNMTL